MSDRAWGLGGGGGGSRWAEAGRGRPRRVLGYQREEEQAAENSYWGDRGADE